MSLMYVSYTPEYKELILLTLITETVHASTNTIVPVNYAGIMVYRLIWIYTLLILISVNLSNQSKN